MFDHSHYVPVLKWKRGEQVGLEQCTTLVKNSMTPLLEIPPIPWNFDVNKPKKTVDDHIGGVVDAIVKSWGAERRFFLDTMNLGDEACDSGENPLVFLTRECLSRNLHVVPAFDLSISDTTLDDLRGVIADTGICLRICEELMEDPDVFRTMVETVLKRLNVTKEDVDLIIDLGYKSEPVHLVFVRSLINDIVFDHEEWRSFTLAFTSFPEDMGGIARDSIEQLRRLEWETWEKLLSSYKSGSLRRMPTFGDYCIANPAMAEVDPRTMNQSGHIRYTIQDEFMIVKGGAVRNVRRGGVIQTKGRTFKQMTKLCKVLVSKPQFCGSSFSWGDQYIQDCANGQVSHGNAETWRRVGTNHHLTFVAQQISIHPGI